MAYVNFNVYLADDDTKVGVETVVDGEPVVRVELEPRIVELLMEELGRHRSLLVDRVPELPDMSADALTVHDPNYAVDQKPGEVALSLGHPYYGWLRFSFQPVRALELSRTLEDLATRPAHKKP